MQHDYDFPEALLLTLQKEFEDGLIERQPDQWADRCFLDKSSEHRYTYNMTDTLWYQFLVTKRNWPEDAEPGTGDNMYSCHCAACKNEFAGYKRRSVCKLCNLKMQAGDKPKFTDPIQMLIVPKDLEISPGKLMAQTAHASVAAILKLGHMDLPPTEEPQALNYVIPIACDEQGKALLHWMTKSFPKVTLECKNAVQLKKLYDQAVEAGLPCSYIEDLGRTEFGGVPTPTCVAIGPAPREVINLITKRLRLYSKAFEAK